jgi:Uncharacterized protein containing LysM domain
MSLELIRQAIRLNQSIGEDTTQTIVENDIIVPDIKPDIARILLLDGEAIVNGTEAVQDKILINGTIRYKILYISDDGDQPVKSINTSAGFRYALEIPDVRQGMNCKAVCDIEHIEYDVINSRKVNVKTILNVNGKAENRIEQNLVSDFEGIEGVQLLRSTAMINSFTGSSEAATAIKETMEVPAGKPTIREILRNDIKITGKDYKITEGRIIAKGELNISTLYIGDDENRSIQYMEHEIPFTQSLEQAGVDEGSFCELEYVIADSSFEPEEDNDGELRFLKGEIEIKILADSFEKREIEVIDDAYSPTSRLSLEKEPVKMEETVAENKSQVILKDTIAVNDDSPDIAEIFNVLYKPSISECVISDDVLTVEGALNSNVLYLAANNEQPVYCCNQDIPFKHSMDIKGIKPEMGCDIDMNIEHCSYSMVSVKEVEIRIVLGLSARIINHVVVPVITKVVEQPGDERSLATRPSIIIYFAQRGDNLWKIAKKYYTTIDELKRVNSLGDTDVVNPGDQIIIPGKLG